MPDTPVSSPRGNQIRNSPTPGPPTNPNHCLKCLKAVTKTKPSLKCNICHFSAHTYCLPDWADVLTMAELTKITSRTGLVWYCHRCLPKLPEYFFGPGVKPRLEQIDDKIENLTRLVTDSHKLTKTFAQVTGESNDNNAELKVIAERLDQRAKRESLERQKLERNQSAILHGLTEEVNTHKEVSDIVHGLGFLPNSITRVSRLGVQKLNRPQNKPRPVKIQFHTEIMKIDFLRYFNRWSDRDWMFATPDLTKEEQAKEYKLRCIRNNLSDMFKDNKYRIRSGQLQCSENGTEAWIVVDESGNAIDSTVSADQSSSRED